MAKMRDMDVRAYAVKEAAARYFGHLAGEIEFAGQNTVAMPIMVDVNGDGNPVEVWVTAQLTVKQWKPYNVRGVAHSPYDPFEAEAEWQRELGVRAQKAADREAAKARKAAKKAKVEKEGE